MGKRWRGLVLGLVALAGVAALLLYLSRPFPFEPGIRWDNVERIKAGMTQREVETILGSPPQHSWRGPEEQVTANTPLYYHKALMWSGTECDILVYLDDAGLVIDREGVGGPPPSWFDRLRKRLGV